MHRLILLRHAKSDWPAGVADHERPLNGRGRRGAPLIGGAMAERGYVPERALVSSARRTQETWALAKAAGRTLPEGSEDARLYHASVGMLMAVIGQTPEEIKSLALVGHNPGLEALAGSLVAEGPLIERQRVSTKYPTGGLAVIDCDIAAWRDIRPKCGTLIAFISPRDLDAGAE
ncbi:SixA phosphatase family protein [Phreatobacter stygius]|uniref:Histidine phosphatase family protein n=1 Tax=Phreatobacter stygius TaxID=1940610 RepID=A0A4D7AZ97_9HYPH|nr:histidine phosphatase family protein [Phreatobacter stygius]QCI63040.1 histidine phosphatase family protein [Phreatobacter stygius]